MFDELQVAGERTVVFIKNGDRLPTARWIMDICWRVHEHMLLHPWKPGEDMRLAIIPYAPECWRVGDRPPGWQACADRYVVYVQSYHMLPGCDLNYHVLLVRRPPAGGSAIGPAVGPGGGGLDDFLAGILAGLFFIGLAYAMYIALTAGPRRPA